MGNSSYRIERKEDVDMGMICISYPYLYISMLRDFDSSCKYKLRDFDSSCEFLGKRESRVAYIARSVIIV